jgi:hypothetical protein
MENELDDSFDINVEAVNAKERMGKYGVLNTIDSLAKEDILRWLKLKSSSIYEQYLQN